MKLFSSLTPIQKRIFIGSFIAMFLVTIVQHLSLTQTFLVRPIPEKQDIIETLRPLLSTKKNTFHLKKHSSLIQTAHAAEGYENAAGYGLINLDTGEVIKEKNVSRRIPIASLTKVMTAVVALDLASSEEYFTVTEHAATQIPTKIGVIPGERMQLRELLEAMLLTSANDSAQVIQDGIDAKYGEPVFIKAMNEKARILGLAHSHFTNPQGFDNPAHYSSVEDLAILTHYSLNEYPLLRDIVSKDFLFLPADANHKQFDLYNWNGLLGVYPGTSGVKIGSTDEAGKTTIVVSERGGESLMAIVLGAPTILKRDIWTASLLDDGFSETRNLPKINVTEEQLYEKYQKWQYFN